MNLPDKIDGPAFTGTATEFKTKYKPCTQCKRWKLRSEFSPHKTRPGGQAACKACRADYARARYAARTNPAIRNIMKKGASS